MTSRADKLEQRLKRARKVVVGTALGEQLWQEYMADQSLTYRALARRHKLAVGTVMRAIKEAAKR